MFPRRGISIILLVLLGIAALAPKGAAAQRSGGALKQFTDTQFGYSLSYPATWIRSPSPTLDVLLQAPDTLAMLGGKGINGSMSTPALRQVVDSTMRQMGASVGKITHSVRVIHGVTFQVGQATAANVHGVKEADIIIGASRHARTYLFFGTVALEKPAIHLTAPHAQAESAQIHAIFDSITITG